MKKNLNEIIVVADRSGSMEVIREDAIGAFNAYLDDQKKSSAEIRMTYVQFDAEYELVYSGRAIADVPPLTPLTYVPRGSTALLDAVARTIDDVGLRFSCTPEADRPERVLFVIMTDGQENASRKFTRGEVFKKISHQRSMYNWQFVFLAAGEDAFSEAQGLGILRSQIFGYQAGNKAAHVMAMRALSETTESYTGGGSADIH